MIRSLFYITGQPIRTDIPPKELTRLLRRRGLFWVDFTGEPPEVCEPILRDFGFHPLAIEDALQKTHVPKIDDWGAYLYIVLNVLRYRSENGSFHPIVDELDVFLGNNYIVTHHHQPLAAIDDTCRSPS